MNYIIDSRAIFAANYEMYSMLFDTISISILFCEYFVIPNYKGQKNKLIIAKKKILRYIRRELTT